MKYSIGGRPHSQKNSGKSYSKFTDFFEEDGLNVAGQTKIEMVFRSVEVWEKNEYWKKEARHLVTET